MSTDVVNARILSTYAVPVSIGAEVTVTGPFPLSAEEWLRFVIVLEAMRPGLVSKPVVEPDPAMTVGVES
jgi:hypothetical protein